MKCRLEEEAARQCEGGRGQVLKALGRRPVAIFLAQPPIEAVNRSSCSVIPQSAAR